ncbi:MAG: LytR family transcriptional regulator [Gaiellales bacterium]|nr:MAG: LytR family transcriptional regulator [Gaiellales bacterium]
MRSRKTLDKELKRGRKRGEGTVPVRQEEDWQSWPETERTPDAAAPRPGGGQERRPVKPVRWGRVVLYGLVVALVAILALAGISYWRVDRAVRESNDRVPDDAMAALDSSFGLSSSPVNILFIGSDQRPGESARADTLLMMRVDAGDKVISQLSIPRDTLADIPGYGEGKINSAYSYGGPALQIEAVEDLTGLPVHHYVEIDFDGFPAIVDSLGGVDIDVPAPIDSQYPQGVEWTEVHFDAGPQHMDGETALIYVRVRYSDNDFQRMARQQQFMEALQKSMASPANLARMPITAPTMIDSITTDMTTPELMRLAWVKFRTPPENNRKFVLAGYGQDIGGISYVVLDEGESQAMIQEFLGR